uniref:Hopene-associated glycosyltransferase HpnB n=1 Tax=Cyanothece sp. (strain PCC 7425 / ATCC 29141) TaxID=395961 RepID=B8HKR2_CYAP4
MVPDSFSLDNLYQLHTLSLGLALASLGCWIGLLLGRGQFWRSDQRLESISSPLEQELKNWPTICAVVPARNEASVIARSLGSLLNQDYPGKFTVILVDDQSSDGTATIAQATAAQLGQSDRLQILSGQPLPPGWSGKLWAVEQGIQAAPSSDYLLLTDADISHAPLNLRQLVVKAETESLDLVSLMVLLRCESGWEKLLIPAFVFFFQKLYPFRWVNTPNRPTAAAAGGCVLVNRETLARAGGIAVVRQALIDDCALAAAIKQVGGKIWLGLTTTTHSLRPYPNLETIWQMVARTAFTQLHYSPWLLLGTLVGMAVIYLVPPLATLLGLVTQTWGVGAIGLLTWLLMSLSYYPTIRLYQLSPLWCFTLPLIALLYNLMTLDSALRHWRGVGGAWKGRVYG